MGGNQSFLRKTVDPLGLTGGKAVWEKGYWGGGGGGAKGGRGKTARDPMIELMKDMQKQQAEQAKAAAEAQRQALIQQQVIAGEQSQQMGEEAAQRQLSQFGSMQAIRDANALAAARRAQTFAGQQATGGGFDINRAREESLANLGAAVAGAMLPSRSPMTALPSTTTPQGARRANLFTLPSYSGIQFGGA
jgi:hypothetical protein